MLTKEISIIIPALNEEGTISQCLETVVDIPGIEVIVADGGSTDSTVEIVGQHRDVKVVPSVKGRSVQMNKGAGSASGEILLFLHADCVLSREAVLNVRNVFGSSSFVGGAFKIRLLSDKFLYRAIEKGINFRTKIFKLPYGDQGLFVKRSVFDQLGGFREMPNCEDLDFICRLKKKGEIIILDERISSSIRRWVNHGVLRTSFRNQSLLVSYVLGRKNLDHRDS
ncbi:MAG: TIGR04283 family arsenosugar biosynthesis glycosyltransferase [Candidatus Scalindua rubra]|uniref:Putative glycosyltransferase n=1 Tax=Candidatus Scalindua brodae TaxID=237368 RepID=A0A0B0EJI3_9BACT|nr:MAG: putative glycosyltransferase [Candidatus Scalindua brodae]MBZ0107023.1 TIGR04283 family arsenosugar biosynthesis glycosyltransferase [Candidatus Scalindua rubra]TWU29094.1 PGL/p-HBAD biosynthesis glycosyltransferase [Candidatus Brocadiaceae bacterium S225]